MAGKSKTTSVDKMFEDVEKTLDEMIDDDAGSVALPSDENLKTIQDLARRLISYEEQLADAEQSVKDLKALIKTCSETDIPAAMTEIGMKEFVLDTGEKVKLSEKLKASISKANQKEAFAWLTSVGSSSLIKATFTEKFGAGEKEREQEKKLRKILNAEGYVFTEKKEVHNGALGKLLRERRDSGKDYPSDILGVHEYTETKIELPKG